MSAKQEVPWRDGFRVLVEEGCWSRTFVTSNRVVVTLDSFGWLTLSKGIGDPGYTVPREDVELILGVYHK